MFFIRKTPRKKCSKKIKYLPIRTIYLIGSLKKHYEVIVIVIAWGDRPRSGEENPKKDAPDISSSERA